MLTTYGQSLDLIIPTGTILQAFRYYPTGSITVDVNERMLHLYSVKQFR